VGDGEGGEVYAFKSGGDLAMITYLSRYLDFG